ncbi:MAG: secondary thiamine-phosphate synthase enzyme YjbQ [Acidobacteriota bacterium]|nr:secondary thiamine-phosphate synthase enzyme YjbQ [Acidobacteriota bacterium]MDE3189326.1 secondary thiamine-phosphate synthase enzyme YjbQ [Acidobacteriota bacterium]
MRELSLQTDRKTQLVDITSRVQDAIAGANGASAALVYVPHTTAGVTINEGADPLVGEDIETALERVVVEEWTWKHTEDPDGPNAPSHVRATLTGSQVLIPLRDGRLALGRYQGIYFCEYDGPRERKVYVATLQ